VSGEVASLPGPVASAPVSLSGDGASLPGASAVAPSNGALPSIPRAPSAFEPAESKAPPSKIVESGPPSDEVPLAPPHATPRAPSPPETNIQQVRLRPSMSTKGAATLPGRLILKRLPLPAHFVRGRLPHAERFVGSPAAVHACKPPRMLFTCWYPRDLRRSIP
jgi:hypothetical protein